MLKYNWTEEAFIVQNFGSGAMFYLSKAIEIRLIEMTFVCADRFIPQGFVNEKFAKQLRRFCAAEDFRQRLLNICLHIFVQIYHRHCVKASGSLKNVDMPVL